MVCVAAEGIGKAVVAHIHHDIDVIATNGLAQNTLCLTCPKAGGLRFDQVGIPFITIKFQVVFLLMFTVPAPYYNVVIDSGSQLYTARQRYDAKAAYGKGI